MLSQNIIALIKNTEKRIALAEAANQYVKRFEWEHSVNKLEKIFNDSLHKSDNR